MQMDTCASEGACIRLPGSKKRYKANGRHYLAKGLLCLIVSFGKAYNCI